MGVSCSRNVTVRCRIVAVTAVWRGVATVAGSTVMSATPRCESTARSTEECSCKLNHQIKSLMSITGGVIRLNILDDIMLIRQF